MAMTESFPPLPAESNPYAPPQGKVEHAPTEAAPFYVVSATKATLLMVFTFGLYSLYWFWRHWTMHKRTHQLDIWPVPRAIFSIFFAHSLNQEINQRLLRIRSPHRWSPGLWATVYVVTATAGRILGRLPESAISLATNVVLLVLVVGFEALAIRQAQRAANVACGDPDAQANRRLTAANYAWLLLGALIWGLTFLGLLADMFFPDEVSA